MRDYLQNLNIAGCVGVWSEGEICRYAIESLLKHCNKVFIIMDYSDDTTKNIVMEYKDKYPEIIVVGDTSELVAPPDRTSLSGMMQRQKNYVGEILESGFKLIKKEHAKKPINLLYFIDSDEIFTNSIGKAVEIFWEGVTDTMFIAPIAVYTSMYITCHPDLICHAKVYKYTPEISAIPYSQQNYYLPYRLNRNISKKPWLFVHLAKLTEENIKLRTKLRGNILDPKLKLRRISKPAYELTPEEGQRIYLSDKFVRLEDWDNDINSLPLIL